MGSVSIHLVTEADAAEMRAFEWENRTFFRTYLPVYGDHHYTLENFRQITAAMAAEHDSDLSHTYLIRNAAGDLAGRILLFDLQRGALQKADVGYRVGERHNRKGYATEAVRLVLAEAFGRYGLERVAAGAAPENIGSQVVLVKNGFQFVGRVPHFVNINGVWHDSISFSKVSPYVVGA